MSQDDIERFINNYNNASTSNNGKEKKKKRKQNVSSIDTTEEVKLDTGSLCDKSDNGNISNLDLESWVQSDNINNAVNYISTKYSAGITSVKSADDMIILSNFLPLQIANSLSRYLQILPETSWNRSSSKEDMKRFKNQKQYGAGSTEHAFAAAEGILVDTSIEVVGNVTSQPSVMDKFLSILSAGIAAATGQFDQFIFQCGRYTSGHFIEPHDDSAQKDIVGRLYNRDVAFIIYLTKSWKFEYGGLFIDHGVIPPNPIVPRFNTLVTFKVPRLHEVTAVEELCTRKRYSIFGWSLIENLKSIPPVAKVISSVYSLRIS